MRRTTLLPEAHRENNGATAQEFWQFARTIIATEGAL
jgi:hypothetical protein